MPKALITGITGQDGSFLAELLLSKGYLVSGIVRRVALDDPVHHMWRLRNVINDINLVPASLESYASIISAVQATKPDECYHLAAQSYVGVSFEDEFSTFNTNINGTHHVLSAIRMFAPDCRVYFAASSEMFGRVAETPQRETTPFHPRSPYGISKVAGFELTRSYREGYGLHGCNGIMFNHESPRRGYEFVTRKITSQVARIKNGLETELRLGNLDARRDWGHASDYVKAMWLMLQQDEPGDFVVATGKSHTVREFCDLAFSIVGLDYRNHVTVDERFYRPAETDTLLGDASKAKRILGWEPAVTFEELVEEMVAADLANTGSSSTIAKQDGR